MIKNNTRCSRLFRADCAHGIRPDAFDAQKASNPGYYQSKPHASLPRCGFWLDITLMSISAKN
jgi:hypothetical protein